MYHEQIYIRGYTFHAVLESIERYNLFSTLKDSEHECFSLCAIDNKRNTQRSLTQRLEALCRETHAIRAVRTLWLASSRPQRCSSYFCFAGHVENGNAYHSHTIPLRAPADTLYTLDTLDLLLSGLACCTSVSTYPEPLSNTSSFLS